MHAHHTIYAAGNGRFIAWMHEDANRVRTALESRPHASIYDKCLSDEESTYVAVHVGLFWCIGTFRIKDGENLCIAVSANRAPSLLEKTEPTDGIMAEKIHFINALAEQRKIRISYESRPDSLNAAEAEIARLCG